MSKVKFWAVLNNKMLLVSGLLEDTLAEFFQNLRDDADVVKHIPAKLSYDDCHFYKLKHPVSVVDQDVQQDDDFEDSVKQAYLDESNRVDVRPTTLLRQLAKELSRQHIHLIIDFPDPIGESIKAIGKLREEHGALFKCLQVTIGTSGVNKWKPDDVKNNMQGGIITTDFDLLPSQFKAIQEALAKKRVYEASVCEAIDEHEWGFRIAHGYRTEFDRIFTPGATDAITVISDREFVAFYNVLRCFHTDAKKIAHNDSSSSLKASNFTVHFIQPPFFSENDDSRGFQYQQEKPWGFPIFVETRSSPDAWRKFTPKSDWQVISPRYRIPFVISEVISQAQQKDRSRMLIQAIALARTGRFLLQSTSKKTFFVVAVYVDAEMVASRYIVIQTGRETFDDNSLLNDTAVCIHQKDFRLTVKEQEVDFLREMYNLATQITSLSADLDERKKQSLENIKIAATKVLSLSTQITKTKTGAARSTDMNAIMEERDGSNRLQDEDGLGVFEAQDIQNVLHQMNYEIEFIPLGHPHLAVIMNKTGDQHGYLKFVEREREVKILQYLTTIESPSNHTISDVRFWPVEGGTVISMPVAGGWLTSLHKPGEQLRSVALQLFEAVAFMHEHNVAHMDLKPQNVIIPKKGGRLSIIDFSASIRVRGPDVRYSGFVGTEGYIAPEVRIGQYKPMLADLWSCGRTLEELCAGCGASADRTMLLEISKRLMSRDPEARPTMSAVLKCITPAQREEDNVKSPTLRFSSAVSPLRA